MIKRDMSFKDLESQVEFKLEDAFSWGVRKDKFSGYSIPVVLSEEDAARVSTLAEENGAKDPMYGRTIYLKSNLSDKQKTELLNKGRSNILIHFRFTGVRINTKKGVSYLISKVTKLRKTEKPEIEEEFPED